MTGEWQELPFIEAVVVNPEVSLRRGVEYPFVDMQAVDPSSRCVHPAEQRTYRGGGSRFLAGDTIMARITPCLENGKIGRYCGPAQSPAHGSTEFIVIRGRDGVTDSAYAFYLTKWEGVRGYAISQMTGTSGRQRVPTEALAHVLVPVPSLPDQRAIAHILGTLDDKIELLRRMSETLEAMARALFKSWFVDFDPVRAKAEGRDPGLPRQIADLFPDDFESSELGEIPAGWRAAPIGAVTTCVGGSTPSTKEASFWGGNIAFATPKDLASLSSPVLLRTERRITESGASQISSRVLPPGTVLLSSRAPIGYLAISEIPVAVNQGFIAMICNKDVASHYVLQWARSNLDIIVSQANGTTFLEISKTAFRPIPVVVPPKPVLHAFVSFVDPIHRRIVSNLNESHKLATLRDTLLPRLISGDIQVPPALCG